MMKYRKKPVVVDAEQFTDANWPKVYAFLGWKWEDIWEAPVPDSLSIDTLEGVMTARKGDFIIRGVQGEFYPCKPDIFEATYEPA